MSKAKFGKEFRLLNPQDFNNLRQDRMSFKSKEFVAYFKKTYKDSSNTRIAFSISRKVGKASVRNRLKRLLREAYRLSDYRQMGQDVLFVISPRNAFNDKESKEIKEKDLLESFAKCLSYINRRSLIN